MSSYLCMCFFRVIVVHVGVFDLVPVTLSQDVASKYASGTDSPTDGGNVEREDGNIV